MATAAQHRQKAEHHRALLEVIPDEFPDWLATVAFYVAVELVELLLATRDLHTARNEQRKRTLRREFPRLLASYGALYNAAICARSEPEDSWLSAEEVRKELIGRRLGEIDDYVDGL